MPFKKVQNGYFSKGCKNTVLHGLKPMIYGVFAKKSSEI